MDHKLTPNKSIQCTIRNCSHHCGAENFCSLDRVSIGTHEVNPTRVECTDCESFEVTQ